MSRRMSKLSILAATLALLVCQGAQAMGPFQVYELAVRNDPVFLAAIKERDAGLENRIIGRAGLLPRLSYNYNKGHNNSKATYPSPRGGNQTDKRNYDSYGSSLTLQQPLFDYEAYASYRKGVAQALFADENFRSKSQELLLRVLDYYTKALFAQDQIDIALAKKKAFDQQFQQNRHLFERGEGTRTDILEAESRYELATAEEIQARDEQDAALRELAALIGEPAIDVRDLDPLQESFQSFALSPATYDSWHEIALSNNPMLASQRQRVEVARYEVERNRAGHLPRLSAYATSRQNESESGNTYNQRYDTNTIGIEISMPLYAGGGVSASTR
ncbi:TolC family outer membrane protein, partial [Pseudomonas sp. BIOMIG1N]